MLVVNTAKRKKTIIIVSLNEIFAYSVASAFLKSYCLKDSFIKKKAQITLKWMSASTKNQNVLRDILIGGPEVVAFSCYLWNIKKILGICSAMRKAGFNGLIVLGGPEVSYSGKTVLLRNPSVDIVVQGEGEATFSNVIKNFLLKKHNLEDVLGIVWRRGNDIVENSPRSPIKDLDEIPSPYLNGIVDLNRIGNVLPAYETHRGCALRCNYCLWGSNNMGPIRYFSLDRVEKELRAIMNSTIRRVWYVDPIANFNKERFKKILRIITENNHKKVFFDFEMRAEFLDDETIDLLSKVQVGYIAFGLQSTNQQVLKNINRSWDRRLFERNILLLKKTASNISIRIDLIYGLPGDTVASYKESFDYAMSLYPDMIHGHRLKGLPGSAIHRERERLGIKFMDVAPHDFIGSDTFSLEDCDRADMYNPVYNSFFTQIVINQLSKCLDAKNSSIFDELWEYFDLNSRRVNLRNIENRITLDRLSAFIETSLSRSKKTKELIPRFTDLLKYLCIIHPVDTKNIPDGWRFRIRNKFRGLSVQSGNIKTESFQYDVKSYIDQGMFDKGFGIRDIKKKKMLLVYDARIPKDSRVYDLSGKSKSSLRRMGNS